MKSDLPLAADDGWDMSPRRDTAVTVDMPTTFEPLAPDRPLPSARGVLSAAEIEALLRPDLSDLPAPSPEPEQIEDKPLPDVEAAPPAPIAANASPTDIPDTARRLASRLSLALRKGCGLRAAAVARSRADGDFETGLAAPIAGPGAAIACFALGDGEVDAMLVLSPELANALIETACGGTPHLEEGRWSPRELTPLDSALLEGLVRPLGAAIAQGLSFAGVETEPDFAIALARPGTAKIVDFDIRVETGRHTARLIIASDLLEQEAATALPAREAAPAPTAAASSLTVVLTARVASLSVPLSRLSDLTAGSTLLLGVPADQPVELLSGGRDGPLVAEAEIGRKGNRMALRISRRVPGVG